MPAYDIRSAKTIMGENILPNNNRIDNKVFVLVIVKHNRNLKEIFSPCHPSEGVTRCRRSLCTISSVFRAVERILPTLPSQMSDGSTISTFGDHVRLHRVKNVFKIFRSLFNDKNGSKNHQPISHRVPEYPSEQVHLNPLTRSWHDPPLRQGLVAQSLISAV